MLHLSLSILVGLALSAQAQKMKLGEIIVFIPFGANRPADSNAYVFQSDRGSRKGQHMLAWSGGATTRVRVTFGFTAGGVKYLLLSQARSARCRTSTCSASTIKVRPERRAAFESS